MQISDILFIFHAFNQLLFQKLGIGLGLQMVYCLRLAHGIVVSSVRVLFAGFVTIVAKT